MMSMFDTLSDTWYWLRTHTINRYHLIDIRCPRNNYKWGWVDRSDAIMYANFAILVDYVENEMSYSGWDFTIERSNEDTENDARYEAHKEILKLYHWWTKGRLEEQDKINELLTHNIIIDPDKRWEEYDKLEQKDEEMLRRLIEVHGYMWT